MLDLQMMVELGGRERTVEEYRALLERVGLRFSRWIPGERFGLIRGRPRLAVVAEQTVQRHGGNVA
jgi:hypothetical protein